MLDLTGIRQKIERADKHIEDLQALTESFIASKPYTISSEPDVRAKEIVYFIKSMRPIDPAVSLIAGDAIQNLRSSLDYLAGLLVLANDRSPDTMTMFPIMESKPTAAKEVKSFERKVQGMRKDAIDLIKRIKPYQGGNDMLWRLHRLNIIDKHRALVTTGISLSSLSSFDVRILRFAKLVDAIGPKEGSEIIRAPLGAQQDGDVHFAFDVAINEPPITRRVPVIALLGVLRAHVVATIDKFSGF